MTKQKSTKPVKSATKPAKKPSKHGTLVPIKCPCTPESLGLKARVFAVGVGDAFFRPEGNIIVLGTETRKGRGVALVINTRSLRRTRIQIGDLQSFMRISHRATQAAYATLCERLNEQAENARAVKSLHNKARNRSKVVA